MGLFDKIFGTGKKDSSSTIDGETGEVLEPESNPGAQSYSNDDCIPGTNIPWGQHSPSVSMNPGVPGGSSLLQPNRGGRFNFSGLGGRMGAQQGSGMSAQMGASLGGLLQQQRDPLLGMAQAMAQQMAQTNARGSFQTVQVPAGSSLHQVIQAQAAEMERMMDKLQEKFEENTPSLALLSKSTLSQLLQALFNDIFRLALTQEIMNAINKRTEKMIQEHEKKKKEEEESNGLEGKTRAEMERILLLKYLNESGTS